MDGYEITKEFGGHGVNIAITRTDDSVRTITLSEVSINRRALDRRNANDLARGLRQTAQSFRMAADEVERMSETPPEELVVEIDED